MLGLALLLCYSYFYYLGGNWNVGSRYAQIMALAEGHTLRIDTHRNLSGDEAYYQGHYYSDKLVGPSLVAVPIYLLARPLAGLTESRSGLVAMRALQITNVVTNALPTALLAALLYLFLAEFGLAPALRVWLTLGFGLGTLVFPYATALFGHNLGAVCITGAFLLLWKQKAEWRLGRGIAAGALIGLGAICDFTTLFLAAFLGRYALWVASGRGSGAPVPVGRLLTRIAPVVVLAAIPVALQLGANWWSFGSPLTFPHVYHIQASFRARHARGMLGVHLPELVPLWQLTFGGHRGLFHGSPMLLLALPGSFLLGKRWKAEAVLLAAAWVGVVLMSSGYENWEAGSAYGPRYQIAAIPLLMLAVACAAERWPFVLKSLTVVSIAFMFIVTAHTPTVAESLPIPLASAIGAFSAGALEQPNLGSAMGLNGLLSLVPLLIVEAGLLLWLRRLQPAAKVGAVRR